MNWLKIVLAIYGAVMLAGGLYGYSVKGSVPSLISSVAATVLLAFGIWMSGSNRSVGFGICAVVALGLAVFFGMRVAGGHYMPGIPALVASVVAFACLIYGHFASK